MFPEIEENIDRTLDSYEKELMEGREEKAIFGCNLNSVDIIALDERKFLI